MPKLDTIPAADEGEALLQKKPTGIRRGVAAGAAVASAAFSRRSFAPSDQQRSVPCDVDAHTSVGSAVPTSFPSWARSASRVGRDAAADSTILAL